MPRLMLKAALRIVFGSYEKYGLPKPEHRIFEAHPMLNSELLHYVRHGRIRPKPGLACFDGQRVHVYIVGTMQPRYGFGPLITRAADLIAQTICYQDQMELPIGLVMKECGVLLPETHLLNPHAALRQMKLAEKLLPLLLRREHRLRRKYATRVNSVRKFAEFQSEADLRVY
ncbi:MAG TPA: hypothetical protein VNQ79_19910 [Blastocatellia bacterium]|nr:hypothetical protein [Blastocatellia bacterium]